MFNRITLVGSFIWVLLIVCMLVLACLSMYLDVPTVKLLLKEGGIIETMSAVGYFLCIIYLFYKGGRQSLCGHWYMYVIYLAMALRELDFDKRFTDPGLLQSRFLTSATVDPLAKIIGALINLLLVFALFSWIKRHAKPFLVGLLAFGSAQVAAMFTLCFVVFSKSMDGLARKLEPLGIDVPKEVNELATRFEEIFELAIPATILYAIFLYWNKQKTDENSL